MAKDYIIPTPIVDKNEWSSLTKLNSDYEKLQEVRAVKNAGKKAADIFGRRIERWVPEPIKDLGKSVKSSLPGQDIFNQAMDILRNSYSTVQKQAAKATLSEDMVLDELDQIVWENKVYCLDEACLARSYDIEDLVKNFKTKDIALAGVEGAATGMLGFAGVPFNLVLSLMIYYRAVQAVAMYYGYDASNDPVELLIASDVFTNAFNLEGEKTDELSALISELIKYEEKTSKDDSNDDKAIVPDMTWDDMAARGGASLILAKIRELASEDAQDALKEAGHKSLEESLFDGMFEQAGRKIVLSLIQKGIPVIGGVIGAIVDSAQMNSVLDYAQIFYQKRFIYEKELRVAVLLAHTEEIDDAEAEGSPAAEVQESERESKETSEAVESETEEE